MEELYQQIEEITQRLDDNETSLQDFSDSLDTNLSDIQQTIDEQTQNLDNLNETQGQLQFPLNQETIDLIKEQFPVGAVALQAGLATVKDGRITNTSILMLSVSSPAGTRGFLSYAVSDGQVIITSTSATDTSTVTYLIL